MTISSEFLTKQWESNWQSDYGDPADRRAKAKEKIGNLLSLGLTFKPGMKILDGGCGDGSILSFLKEEHGIVPFGLDLSPTALNRANETSVQKNHNLNLARADIREVPFQDNFFDTILCFGVIEHFPDYDTALSEFHRVLKPDGHLILVQPHKYSLRHLKMWWLKARNEWPYGLQINFSADVLGKALSKPGFRNTQHIIKPYKSDGVINSADYHLNKAFPGWGYYLYLWTQK